MDTKKPNNVIPFETVQAFHHLCRPSPVLEKARALLQGPLMERNDRRILGTSYEIALYLRWIDAINGG